MTIPYADVSQTRGNGIVAFIDERNVVAKEAFASILAKKSAVLVWECFRIIMMRLDG